MSFAHLLTKTCYVEDVSVDATGVELFDDDGDYLYTGVVAPLKCAYLKRQRLFRTGGTDGDAGERVSSHELVTNVLIKESSRVWLPGKDQTLVNQSLVPISLSEQERPYGGLILFHTFL